MQKKINESQSAVDDAVERNLQKRLEYERKFPELAAKSKERKA